MNEFSAITMKTLIIDSKVNHDIVILNNDDDINNDEILELIYNEMLNSDHEFIKKMYDIFYELRLTIEN